MAKVIHPYTGIELTMPDDRAIEYVAAGYKLAAGCSIKPIAQEAVEEDAEPDMGLPDEKSTIGEIRAYAKARGIDLPKGNKAALLAAIR